MKTRTTISHYVPCQCYDGGLTVSGIEIIDEEGYIRVRNVHTYGIEHPGGLWQRVKNAWDILRGQTIYGDAAVLGRDSVELLRDACQNALDRWPEPDLIDNVCEELEDIYQSLEDEKAGRKLRIQATYRPRRARATRFVDSFR